jgi:hypothetical protein
MLFIKSIHSDLLSLTTPQGASLLQCTICIYWCTLGRGHCEGVFPVEGEIRPRTYDKFVLFLLEDIYKVIASSSSICSLCDAL